MAKSNRDHSSRIEKAVAVFTARGGVLRMSDAMRAGVQRGTLYEMLDKNYIERLSRGLYRLADAPPLGNPDLVTVAKRVPQAVVCLISALAYHELTTQIPHEVHIAVQRNAEPPRLDYPPIRSYRFSGQAFSAGIETPSIDGIPVRIYDREKTLADCFKYRNRIGLDTVLEALRLYKERRRVNADSLLRYAGVCRVGKVMRPYLEAIL